MNITPSTTKRSTRFSASARTQNKWLDKPVSRCAADGVYDLMRMGPTSANMHARRAFVFVVSKEAKERLKPHCSAEGNAAKDA